MKHSATWQAEFPFRSQSTSIGGYRYHFVDEGAGPPILMVHGNPTWSFYWRHLIRKLSPDYRAIAVDHIGCGLSEKPQDFDYCLANHIANLVEFIERFDLKSITLIGHDWGGAIGLGAAVRSPERFSRFVMFNTAAFPPPFFPWRIRACRIPLVGEFAVRSLNWFSLAAMLMAVERPSTLSDAFSEGILAPYDSWENRIAIDRFVKDIPESPDHRTWDELVSIESGLTKFTDHPFCLIWGMKDWCFRPACLRRFQRILPNAETHEIRHAGHWVVEEAKDSVNEIVSRFLANSDVPAAAVP